MPAPQPAVALLRLFMQRSLFFPFTILDQLKFRFERLLILLGVVVDVLADRALEFDQIILRHGGWLIG